MKKDLQIPSDIGNLRMVEKAIDGTLTTRQILPVQFVPLTGGH